MGSSVGRNSSLGKVMTIELRSQYHLFRYASEWDPREKGKTKGGYLEGRINLPRVREDMRVVVSTCPAPGSELGSGRCSSHLATCCQENQEPKDERTRTSS